MRMVRGVKRIPTDPIRNYSRAVLLHELKLHSANRPPNAALHATDRAARREESFRREDMPTFITAAPRWKFAAARRSHQQIARRKRRSFSELARGSIVACCSMCGAAIAEEGQPVPNYKELINSAVKSSFVDPSSVGLIEISPLHPSRPPQSGDWMACLRIAINGQPTLYAAFIEGQPPSVVLLRLAVRFDDCGQDQYEVLPGPPPIENRSPNRPRKK